MSSKINRKSLIGIVLLLLVILYAGFNLSMLEDENKKLNKKVLNQQDVIIEKENKIQKQKEIIESQNNELNNLRREVESGNIYDIEKMTNKLLSEIVETHSKAYYIRNELLYNNKKLTMSEANYQALWIYSQARKYEINPYKLTAVGIVESNLIHKKDGKVVRSHKNAIGMFQPMPATARIYNVNPLIFEENVTGAAKMLNDLNNMYSEDKARFAHYNAGSRPYEKLEYESVKKYVENIMRIYNAMCEKYKK